MSFQDSVLSQILDQKTPNHSFVYYPQEKKDVYLVKGFKFLEFFWSSGNLNSVGCKYLSEPHNARL